MDHQFRSKQYQLMVVIEIYVQHFGFHDTSSHPMAIIQRARINPKSLTHADIMQLQRTIGNRAVGRLLSEIGLIPSKPKQAPPVQRQELVQRQEIPEEEEPLQGKFESGPEKETCPSCMQRQEIPEEEEPLQGKMIETIQRQEIPEEEEPLQGKFENKPEICPSCFAAPVVQRQEIPEEEPLQGKMIGTIQRQEIPEEEEPLQTKKENNTGMPDNLKAGVESLSGIDMSDVRVHYNSSKPADVGALAYTQGTNIHVAPGQERHLPHEAWHVVQQKQGRVKPTMQMKDGVPVNDDEGLEHEAGIMGGKALHKYAQVAEAKESKSRAVAFFSVQKKSYVKQRFEVEDNRPEAKAQKSLQLMMNHNLRPIIQRLKTHSSLDTTVLHSENISTLGQKNNYVIQLMTAAQAANLLQENYSRYPLQNFDYTQTADGNTLWKFCWYDNNRQHPIEIHVHGDPERQITGINVRWYQNPQDAHSVNPAPYWIQAAVQTEMIAILMNLPPEHRGRGLYTY